jgi:polyphosphate kinase
VDCYEVVHELNRRRRKVLRRLIGLLAEQGIVVTRYDRLAPKEQAYLRELYYENIFPLVTPQATDPAHPFPFIPNLSINLLVTLRYPDEPVPSLARVKVPVGSGSPRLLKLKDQQVYVPLEEVMANNLDLLFPGMEIDSCALFRVTRNANTEREEERADDLLAMIESELRDRKFAPVVRLEVEAEMTPHLRGQLAAELGLDENIDVFEVPGMMAMRDLMELVGLRKETELHDPAHHPVDHPEMGTDRKIFHIIRDAGSILLHHPYQAYTTSTERFLKEACRDPKVLAIKMTLYRTAQDSKEIQYLIEAARHGKQVAVCLELKARFDEEANIRWANRMEEMGIHVTYGVIGLKTHCKVVLVVRQDYNVLRRYAHIGTGNYHAETARLYCDLGMLTCDDAIGQDLSELFNYLTTGFKPKRNYRKILPAPKILKAALLQKIDREIAGHSEESPGLIQFKLNALEDVEVTRALYRASQAGVKIDLIVRDTCRLRPGIEGLSENVRVISIVGRFLEHTRICYFRNGGDEEYFIGSADCMKRNLNSRVEVYVPVEDPGLRKDLRVLLDLQLSDGRGAWEMQSDGSYVQRKEDGAVHSQQSLIAWADTKFRDATRLKRRKPRGIKRRNVR